MGYYAASGNARDSFNRSSGIRTANMRYHEIASLTLSNCSAVEIKQLKKLNLLVFSDLGYFIIALFRTNAFSSQCRDTASRPSAGSVGCCSSYLAVPSSIDANLKLRSFMGSSDALGENAISETADPLGVDAIPRKGTARRFE